jgi:endonuclease YncB( thermonuclease family)
MIPSYTSPFDPSRRALIARFAGVVAGFGFLKTAGFSAYAESPGRPSDTIALSAPEIRDVAEVIDGNLLRLAGGEQLRLLATETPDAQQGPGDSGLQALVSQARDTLVAAIAGRPIALRADAVRRDRYGRRLAHAFTADGTWLQAELVKAGCARVHGDARNRYGLRALMVFEAEARMRKSGIWRHPSFAVRSASDPNLERLAGSFQIVAGRVMASAVAKGIAYVNFGADHDTDLTLVLNKPVLAAAEAAMLDVAGLAGKSIRCRGWIESFNGPRIQVTHPEQIELLED